MPRSHSLKVLVREDWGCVYPLCKSAIDPSSAAAQGLPEVSPRTLAVPPPQWTRQGWPPLYHPAAGSNSSSGCEVPETQG